MTEVVIHRCTLKVVRRDGWSWGPDPKRLLQGAIKVLPELLASALSHISHGERRLEIAAPVRISIPVRLDELSQMPSRLPVKFAASLEASDLNSRLTQALTAALQRHGLIDPSAPDRDHSRDQTHDKTKKDSQRRAGNAVVSLLLIWLDQRILEQRLERFSTDSLEAWHRKLIEANDNPSSELPDDAMAEMSRMADELTSRVSTDGLDRRAILLRRIVIAVQAMQLLKRRSFHSVIRDVLDRMLPVPDPESHRRDVVLDPAVEPALSVPADKQEGIRRLSAKSSDLPRGEVHVASALPFLLVGPLSRMGYLQVLAATLEVAEATHHQRSFATALAYKVLDPPARGWRRSPDSLQSAAVFAGTFEPADGDELHDLADTISKHLSPMDSILTDSLVEGHAAASPFLLQRRSAEGEFVLLDIDGLFPIQCCDRLETLFPVLARCPSSVLLIPVAIADPNLLGSLNSEGFRFVTDAQPTRAEKWRRLGEIGTRRWWTNDHITPAPTLVKSANLLEPNLSDAEELMDEVFYRRPILPPPRGAGLDRHISVAAAIALGTISWTLWNHREATNPQLALQRFNDLDGWITFAPDHVRVRLPMGRRFQDLLEHRLIEDVDDVPWLEGKTLQFSGG